MIAQQNGRIYVLIEKPFTWGQVYERAGIPFARRDEICVLPVIQSGDKFYCYGKEITGLEWHETQSS